MVFDSIPMKSAHGFGYSYAAHFEIFTVNLIKKVTNPGNCSIKRNGWTSEQNTHARE